MKVKLFLFAFVFGYSCSSSSQESASYDFMPIDTTLWSLTETVDIDFNGDGLNDRVLVFDKYKKMTRPDNIQTPVLFYLAKHHSEYSLLTKTERIIYVPHFTFDVANGNLIINQKGVGSDINEYLNYYGYQNGELKMLKSVVVQYQQYLEVDEKTGDVKTISTNPDTIFYQPEDIKLVDFNFMEFMEKFN